MTADADLDGAQVVLVCDGSVWQPMTGSAAAPDRGIQFNSGNALTALPDFIFTTDGYLGLGTPYPWSRLHVSGEDEDTTLIVSNNSSTTGRWPGVDIRNYSGAADGHPSLSLFRARGSADTPGAVQAWDTLGSLNFRGLPSSGDPWSWGIGAWIGAHAAEDWDETSMTANLEFGTTPPGQTWPVARMTITNVGRVGIGTEDPASALHVNGGVAVGHDPAACSAYKDGTLRYTTGIGGPAICPSGGAEVAGSCWYYGNTSESCDAVCAAVSLPYDGATLSYAGSGGNNGQCGAVLDAIGAPGSGDATSGSCTGANTIGCAWRTSDSQRRRCGNSATSSSASNANYRRACACGDGPVADASDGPLWEYCDGGAEIWRPFEHAAGGGCAGDPTCPNIGDVCADGSLFAGFVADPAGGSCRIIYVTDSDQSSTSTQWKNAIGTNDISTVDHVDGQVNHANRGGALSDFPAFDLCEANSYHGKSDWYLPARAELNLLWLNRAAINANAAGSFASNDFWSSTEHNMGGAWYQDFGAAGGGQYNALKTDSDFAVRCIRSVNTESASGGANGLPNCSDDTPDQCVLQSTRADGDPEFTTDNIVCGSAILGVSGACPEEEGVTWDPVNKAGVVTLENENVDATGSNNQGVVVATHGLNDGTGQKAYFEIEVIAPHNSSESGIKDDNFSSLNNWHYYISGSNVHYDNYYREFEVGTNSSGGWSVETGANPATRFSGGDRLMWALDRSTGRIWHGRNGTWFGSGDPAAGTNHTFNADPSDPWFPSVGPYGGTFRLHTQASDFSYAIPSGFVSFAEAVYSSGACSSGGIEVGGACWYQGWSGQSCTTVCTARGLAYSDATRDYADSGGDVTNCTSVLNALGLAGSAVNEAGCGGYGCVFYDGTERNRCTASSTTAAAAEADTQRVCACE